MLEFSEVRPEEKNVYSITYSTEDKMVRKMKMVVSFHPLGLMCEDRIEYVYDIEFKPPTIHINVLRHRSWDVTKTRRVAKFSVDLPDDFEIPWWLNPDELVDTIRAEGTRKTIELIFDYLKALLSLISTDCLNFNL